MKKTFFTILAIVLTQVAMACTATFSFGVNGLTATFNNTSVYGNTPGQMINALYDFGDNTSSYGSTSGLTNHTYNAPGTYTVSLTVSVIDSLSGGGTVACQNTSTQSVTVSYNPCTATFIDTLVSGTTYNFAATILGGGTGITYNWSFGDGGNSTLANPTHTYASNGTYYVTLITTGSGCQDSVWSTITIGNTGNTNTISGIIIKDSMIAPLTANFMVWLITYDSASQMLTAIDSVSVSGVSATAYLFNNEPPGVYRVKAAVTNAPVLGSTGCVPTYHDSSLYWNTANTFYHSGGTTSGEDIYMLNGIVTSGPGFIGGNVTTGANKSANKTTSGTPLPNLQIYLVNSNNQMIASTLTDASGNYSFSNLPLGVYSIRPEDMNYATTPINNIIISSTQNSVTAMDFKQHTISKTITPITSGIATTTVVADINIFPNPSNTGIVTLTWGTLSAKNTQIAVTNVTGQKVYQAAVNMDNSGSKILNLSQLQSGIYYITIDADNVHRVQKFVLNR
ncbi:MAG: PKD domain-containing protein [Bacteroidota bacterium]